MDADLISFSGIMLMFVLGLRHGLDPDHIACIDGLTWRTLDRDHNHHMAPWVGTLFAIGHGLLVTGIAVGVNQLSRGIHVPDTAVTVFGWVPTLLLLLVGTLNLRQLRVPGQAYAPTGWKMRLIPARLRNHSNPLAIVLIGVLFATVFDTATQASAWGFVATNSGGFLAAAGAGLVFTVGMMITDTLDGRLLCHVVRRSDGEAAGKRYRRALGWLIVALSYGVAGYNIGKAVVPAIELDEAGYSMLGASLVSVVVLMWAWTYRTRLQRISSPRVFPDPTARTEP